jgi:hypothetical protein
MAAAYDTMFASFNNCTTSAAGTSVRNHNGLDTVLLAVSIIVSLNIGILGINV